MPRPRRREARRRPSWRLPVAIAAAVLAASCRSDRPPSDLASPAASAPASPIVTPSPSPSTTPSTRPTIPGGVYLLTAPITPDEARANGLRGLDVIENLGLFTLELEDGGAFTLTQDPPQPVEFPVIAGDLDWSARRLVLTPYIFHGQVWVLEASRHGDRVRFRVLHTTSGFAPAEVRAGVRTIFETHPWELQD